ncbi:MAG: alkaline serine protease [Bdellovibrionaceae bacterium]|nr:alkaline serine protease [Pseudobdellovibrionaceae bacterium]|tara:strand:+ start:21602 stop:22858 length:1257 start_codon:yes stop_codon:yes gene_type:complete
MGESMSDGLRLLFIANFLFLAACSNGKSSESVFPEKSTDSPGLPSSCEGLRIEGEFVAVWEDGSVTRENGVDREQMIRDFVEPNLEQLKRVDYNYEIKTEIVNSNSSAAPNWHHDDVNSHYAWDNNYKGQGVLVAVIDSGVDISHPDLDGQIYTNNAEIPNNGIDDDRNGYVDDYQGFDFFNESGNVTDPNGHGTHVAGIIAGLHQSSPGNPLSGTNGVYGIAPGVKILPIRFMSSTGSGDLADAIKAVGYAADQGASIINASWGASVCSGTLYEKIAEVESKGVLFVAASGNSSNNADNYPEYPGAFIANNILSVAATSDIGALAWFSNYGLSTVDVGAPGEDIYSLAPNSGVKTLSGTSMATPLVAGMAAILKSVKPSASYAELKDVIEKSVDNSQIQVRTRGTVNVKSALNYMGY